MERILLFSHFPDDLSQFLCVFSSSNGGMMTSTSGEGYVLKFSSRMMQRYVIPTIYCKDIFPHQFSPVIAHPKILQSHSHGMGQ